MATAAPEKDSALAPLLLVVLVELAAEDDAVEDEDELAPVGVDTLKQPPIVSQKKTAWCQGGGGGSNSRSSRRRLGSRHRGRRGGRSSGRSSRA